MEEKPFKVATLGAYLCIYINIYTYTWIWYDMTQKSGSPVFSTTGFGTAWLDCSQPWNPAMEFYSWKIRTPMYHTVSTYLPHTNERMSGKTQDALAAQGDFLKKMRNMSICPRIQYIIRTSSQEVFNQQGTLTAPGCPINLPSRF